MCEVFSLVLPYFISFTGSLESPDILSIMSEDSFNMRCLAECIKHGANKRVRYI